MIELAEQWVSQSENVLKTMEKIALKKDKDRLETINAMVFALNALDLSLRGWRQWIQNLGFMARFSEDELREIEAGLIKTVSYFIEYDMDVTKRHEDKIPRVRFQVRKRKQKEDSSGMYV